MFLDHYAYTNRFRDVHPAEKVLFALVTMGVGILSKSIAIQIIIAICMSAVLIVLIKISVKTYISLLLVPLLFALLGVIPILISLGVYQGQGIGVGFNHEGVKQAALILTRSVAAASCLFFISLTTPLIDMLELLRKAKLPATVIEIAALIYRFIFVLMAVSMDIFHSQSARLGYSSFGTSLRSLGRLVSMVFAKAYFNSQALYISLLSRGYEKELNVLTKEYTFNKKNLARIVFAEASLILLAIALGGC